MIEISAEQLRPGDVVELNDCRQTVLDIAPSPSVPMVLRLANGQRR